MRIWGYKRSFVSVLLAFAVVLSIVTFSSVYALGVVSSPVGDIIELVRGNTFLLIDNYKTSSHLQGFTYKSLCPPASDEHVQEVSFSISFEEPQFKLEGGYDLIDISGCTSFASSPGAPMVPKKTVTILLPLRGDVSSIKVMPIASVPLAKELYLCPSQRPVLIGEEPEPEFIPPDPEIYESSKPYPGEVKGGFEPIAGELAPTTPKLHELEFVTSYRGYRIATMAFFPITYTPAERRAVFRQGFEVEIKISEAAESLAFRPTPDAEEWVANNVVNPELMSTYESTGESTANSPQTMSLSGGGGGDAEYLIITRPVFENALENLTELKSERMSVKVVTVENNNGIIEFKVDDDVRTYPGKDVPEQIRNCIKDHYENNGTRWVLLTGDADYDDLGQQSEPNYVLDKPWEVPVRYVWNPDSDDSGFTKVNPVYRPTDYYYAGLDGTWDDDNDNNFGEGAYYSIVDEADWFADVYVGRMPARDESTMQAIVRKTIAYQPHSDNICLFGACLFDYLNPNANGKTAKRHIKDNYIPSWVHVSEYYQKDNTLSYDAFIEAIDNYDPMLVNAASHGSPDGLYICGDGKFVDLNTPAAITNDNFMMYAMACLTNAFDIKDNCLGEVLLQDPDGGAVGYIGGTRVEWGWERDDYFLTWGATGQDVKFFQRIFEYKEHRQGAALYKSKMDYIVSDWNNFTNFEWFEERCCLFVAMLLGDPELSIVPPPTLPPYAVEASVSPEIGAAEPGATLSYTVTVWNMGAFDDNYELTVDAEWDSDISPLMMTVRAGFVGVGELSVTIPENAEPASIHGGDEDVITVTVTSQENENLSDNASCIARADVNIYIEGNDNFTPANGVNGGGSGTVDNPYIIENWDIDASDNHGIWIKNTDAYFIIRNCRTHDGLRAFGPQTHAADGILLENVKNGRIDNVASYINNYAIALHHSNHNIIANCTLTMNNQRSISLSFSDNNILNNNTCSYNSGGIALSRSDNNTISNNTCSNNTYTGIYLGFSDNNTLDNNICENNNGIGIGTQESFNNIIYHNCLLNNRGGNAYDDDTNYWDDGYPSGGNYWSDYTGSDENHGENQDMPGSDGIGDTPYDIPPAHVTNQDHYPLMNPWPLARDIKLSISPSENGGPRGENVTFEVIVTNTGNVPDTYALNANDNAGWGLMLEDNVLEVPDNENRTTTLTVTISESAGPGEVDNITITATSMADNAVNDNASCTAVVALWGGTAVFELENMYAVSLEKDLQLYAGSKLVVKFYKYDNTFQAESVIDEFAPPETIKENENVPHPKGSPVPPSHFPEGTVQVAKLVLTTNNTGEVILTIASFTVHQSNLRARYKEILRLWSSHPELQNAFRAEIKDILSQWSSAPP